MKKIIFIIAVLAPALAFAQINENDYILKGKSIEDALEESVKQWSGDIMDNSVSSPIVVVAIAGNDITEPNPVTRDEVRTQEFRIIENISGNAESESTFIYSVFSSKGEREIEKEEKIMAILKKYKQENKYYLLLAVKYTEGNKKEIIGKLNFF